VPALVATRDEMTERGRAEAREQRLRLGEIRLQCTAHAGTLAPRAFT